MQKVVDAKATDGAAVHRYSAFGDGLRSFCFCSVGLLSLIPGLARANRSNPCAQTHSVASHPAGARADGGYLILKLSRSDLQGRQIFAGAQPVGRLPPVPDQCTWVPLPVGEHMIRIDGLREPIDVYIAAKRTTFVRINENPAGTKRRPLRFAIRPSGSVSDFPTELRRDLLSVAAHADPELSEFDLADEESQSEPQAEADIRAAFASAPRYCRDEDFRTQATLHFVLVVTHQSSTFRVRAYSAALGMAAPVADVDEAGEAGAACQGKGDAARLGCLLLQALNQADERGHYCLQVTTQPTDAQVTLTALRGAQSPADTPLQLQASTGGGRERTLFAGPDQPNKYRLSVDHPRFLPQEQVLDFSQDRQQSVSVSLVPRPVAATPLYKRWWIWQSVATALVVGVTGTIAGIYSNDRGGR